MWQLILLCAMWNLTEAGLVYQSLETKRSFVEEHSMSTMCMTIIMMTAFVMALHLEVLLPPDVTVLQFIPLLIGLVIGWGYSRLKSDPANLLISLYNGAMGGLMGMMLGAVLQNPALCNIPIASQAMMELNTYSLVLFSACLHVVVCHLLRFVNR